MPWAGRKKLPQADALLYHAYSIHKGGLHEACGMPRDEAFDPANEGAYEVVDDETTCFACKAWEQWRRDSEGRDREPGSLAHLRHTHNGADGQAVSQADLLAGYREKG